LSTTIIYKDAVGSLLANGGRAGLVDYLYRFIMRAVLGGVFAVLLMRIFHPRAPIGYTVCLAIGLVAMAYGLSYFRHRG